MQNGDGKPGPVSMMESTFNFQSFLFFCLSCAVKFHQRLESDPINQIQNTTAPRVILGGCLLLQSERHAISFVWQEISSHHIE